MGKESLKMKRILAAILLGCAVLALSACNAGGIDVSRFYKVSYYGVNGHGMAGITVDNVANNDVNGNIRHSLSKDTGLSNGDYIVLKITVANELLEKYGMETNNRYVLYRVDGLIED